MFSKQIHVNTDDWIQDRDREVQSQNQPESSLARDDAQDLVELIECEVNISQSQNDLEEWVLDTGCSFHMSARKELFIDLQETASGKVRMANNSHTEVKGIGSIRFKNQDGNTFLLHEVRYMLGIARNFISLVLLNVKAVSSEDLEES